MRDGLEKAICEACESVRSVDGYVSPEELRFLFIAAAVPTARGEVVEIGSFKGRSTIVLAKGALRAGQQTVVACDPFTTPSPTDPVVGGPTYAEFASNIDRCRVAQHVEAHGELSSEMMQDWSRPVRLLWIDGDHRYAAVRADVEGFLPYLVPGAIVALHDVGRADLPGPLVCFMEDIVLSDAFGMCGVWRSIGWAQFVGGGGSAAYRRAKTTVYRALSALRLHKAFGRKLWGLARRRYNRLSKGRGFERWVLTAAQGSLEGRA